MSINLGAMSTSLTATSLVIMLLSVAMEVDPKCMLGTLAAAAVLLAFGITCTVYNAKGLKDASKDSKWVLASLILTSVFGTVSVGLMGLMLSTAITNFWKQN